MVSFVRTMCTITLTWLLFSACQNAVVGGYVDGSSAEQSKADDPDSYILPAFDTLSHVDDECSAAIGCEACLAVEGCHWTGGVCQKECLEDVFCYGPSIPYGTTCPPPDPCTTISDCSSCIAFESKTCFWVSGSCTSQKNSSVTIYDCSKPTACEQNGGTCAAITSDGVKCPANYELDGSSSCGDGSGCCKFVPTCEQNGGVCGQIVDNILECPAGYVGAGGFGKCDQGYSCCEKSQADKSSCKNNMWAPGCPKVPIPNLPPSK